MDVNMFLGYLLSGLITLGGFIALVIKFTQPINDLRIVIQELKDTLKAMKDNDERRDEAIEENTRDIKALRESVGELRTKVNMYHHD